MAKPEFRLELPGWVETYLGSYGDKFDSSESRMRLAVGLSRRNIEEGTGGPFGAAIFARDTGRLIATGVNMVTSLGCSIWHAEMAAIARAQMRLRTYELGRDEPMELVSSCEPCAMCLGAVPWSGVSRLICGARDEDARAAGFDEGAKPADWIDELAQREIEVIRDVLRNEAAAVLADYAAGGGEIYNG
ncbi:Guanine deaminase [Anaerohalosphaera lusitana]|uniref:Guanine deaminase n=1 Tax=Anaerohalosphaera lusitana TaxID=1936003 RepID=A0A1U9NG90_9BACT|nr:nucleoside deaminase [Anaerohalosphaera lusitana]AQT66951.1 Guanine deaminase [Anaerohalosphaera lusitana]